LAGVKKPVTIDRQQLVQELVEQARAEGVELVGAARRELRQRSSVEDRYPAIVKLWIGFVPFLDHDVDRRAVRARPKSDSPSRRGSTGARATWACPGNRSWNR
jgi:hypothetical protein